jgi:hypothetical protein
MIRVTNECLDEIIEIHEKMFYYLDTFKINSGRDTARQILLDELRKDVVEKKMRSVRSTYLYEKGAREYYAKHGTVGEF